MKRQDMWSEAKMIAAFFQTAFLRLIFVSFTL